MKETLEKILGQFAELGAECSTLIFMPPAKEQEILDIEDQLNYKLPIDFRNALLTISAHCEFNWSLPDDFKLPEALNGIFCGDLNWATDAILRLNKDKDSWIENVFSDPDNEYDKVWHHKFVFQEVGNGDFLSIDLSSDTFGKVVYLSHDDGEGHGYVMASSFSELLSNWVPLGCPGGEDWQWIVFSKDAMSGIDGNSSNAVLWKQTIGL